jgi:hypothetical protein
MHVPRLTGPFRLCLCAILLAFATGVLAEPTRSPIPPDVETVEIGGFFFPRKVAGLSRVSKTDYDSADLGFGVRYEGIDDTWADIYVYDLAQDLTSGAALSHARGELLSALRDIDAGVSSGAYQSANIVDRSEAGSFAKAHLKITQAGKARDSYVFITVHNRNFVKIRLTSGDRKYADRIAQRFLTEYSRVLGKR